jgi:hypothetical protein
MSVRLFHRGARLVLRLTRGPDGAYTWCALHRRPVPWIHIFRPALGLFGFLSDGSESSLTFGTGTLRWTKGPFWTTLRLQLPACSPRKRELMAAGLLKAARYADASEGSPRDPGSGAHNAESE